MLDRSESQIKYNIYGNLSRAFYLYYREFFGNPGHGAYKSGINLAIWFADGAIVNIKSLSEGEEKEFLIKFSESHRAYHYASLSLISNSNIDERAILDIASRTNSFADDLLYKERPEWMSCKDTVAWIFIILGSSEQKYSGPRF